ncbi:MAG: hypothetical protein HQL36_02835 [Alphaproteobacteria bacterium]|nr:hypothetical protein [Alphaproteobacteria bacterium]
MTHDEDETNFFTHNHQKRIVAKFTKYLRAQFTDETKRWCLVDKNGLALAMKQASIDVGFIKIRRGLTSTKGISAGKLTGVILFRLCRHKFVHITNEKFLASEKMMHAQEDAAIATALELLNIPHSENWIDKNKNRLRHGRDESLPDILRELRILITTRHFDQEGIGTYLDALCHLDEAVQYQSPDVSNVPQGLNYLEK